MISVIKFYYGPCVKQMANGVEEKSEGSECEKYIFPLSHLK